MVPGSTRLSIQNCILTSSAVLAQLIAESLSFTTGLPLSPENCPFAWGHWTNPYLIDDFLDTPKSTSQTASQLVPDVRTTGDDAQLHA